jgi:hypothetical protein
MTNWNQLPNEIIKIILKYRKLSTCQEPASIKIQSTWKCYRTRVLIGRFKMLRYLRDFRIWNPTIQTFLVRSFL